MRFWRNWTIGAKVTAIAAAIFLVLGGMGGLALWRMSAINAKAAEIRGVWLPSVERIGKLRHALVRFGRTEDELLLALSTREDIDAAARAFKDAETAVDTAYADFRPLIASATEEDSVMGQFAAIWPTLHASTLATMERARNGDLAGAIHAARFEDTATRLKAQALLLKAADFNEAAGRKAADEGAAIYEATRHLLLAALASAALFCAVIAFALIAGVARPLAKVAAAIERLTRGDLDVDVPDDGRRDEIGGVAHALSVFKANMLRARELEEAARQASVRAEQERRAAAHKIAEDFEDAIRSIVTELSRAAADFQGVARILCDSSVETAAQAKAVSEASEASAGNIGSVASATEELSFSVKEINEQVDRSRQIADGSAQQAEAANRQMIELSRSAERIGDIVSLISDIAGRTNLLALNATIETARAGEAGRGFAVVAQEVKTLAEQTGRATAEITAQIGDIQTTAQQAADNIGRIVQTTEAAAKVAGTIAIAVGQQGAATSEIARNVQQASRGAHSVADNIGGVLQTAQNASTASAQMLASAQALSRQSTRLDEEVNAFLATIRAA
ncbi:methyl-accepting chemotaxis protein [Rhodoblastus sp.]|uniref:methyl-accepting chemotaxis protein n=1 Tax=Rhodoblastus sp. TaxID=1962975 RepID=UPI0035ADCAE4